MMRFQPVSKICNQVSWCWNHLETSLCVPYFELQAKWVITGTVFRLDPYDILTHIHCFCLQLLCLWSVRLEWSSFPLIANTSKMSKPVTSFTLKFLHRALKALFFYLHFPDESSMCWCLIKLICASCGSPAICLMCLAVAFELSILFTSCLTLLAGSFSKSTSPSFMVLDTNSSSCKKNQNISQCRILAVSGGYLARLTCACTALYHLSTLLLPFHKLVGSSKWTLTSFNCGLQNSSNSPQIAVKFRSSTDKHLDTYWPIPRSLLQAITFLHFCCSGSAANSHSKMFSHFKCHFKTFVVEAIIHCPVLLGTFYVWHEHIWYCLLCPRWVEKKLLGLVLDLNLKHLLGCLKLLFHLVTSCCSYRQTS